MNEIICGDCLSVMPTLPANSVDSVITDPPYGLDFMGKEWDCGVPGVSFWQAALRVAKPGAILMAFGGTRTFHRLACAIEDAGWELRDTMCWLYGSGFPKSLDISKAIDKEAGFWRGRAGEIESENGSMSGGNYERTDKGEPITDSAHLWQGYGTALKPAWEPIIVAMKPLEGTYAENAQKWGVAGLNIDGGRIAGQKPECKNIPRTSWRRMEGRTDIPESTPQVYDASQGRWPANLLLDEEAARLLDEQSGELKNGGQNATSRTGKQRGGVTWGGREIGAPTPYAGDHGGASRFFYTAKASSSERNAGLEDMPEVAGCRMQQEMLTGSGNVRNQLSRNTHPTVKPVDLMRYLCKLTRTPTGGVVLDPFMGSGTTGIAALLEHRDFIGIEISPEYAEIAKKRIADMEGPLFVKVMA